MDENPTSINDIMRMDFQKMEQARIEEANQAPAAPEPGTVAPPDIKLDSGGGTLPPAAAPLAAPEPPVSPPARPVADPEARMAKIIAAQQQVRAEREAFHRERQLAEQDRQELEAFRQLKARAKEDPVSIAEMFGYKPDEYAATLVDKGSMTPDRRKILQQDAEIRELKAWREEQNREREQQRVNQAYTTIKQGLMQAAEAAGETYDLVRRGGNYDLALQKVIEHAQTTQAMGQLEWLPYDQALEMAEQELLDKQLAPYLESPKIRSRYGAPASAPQSATLTTPAARQPRGTSANLRAASSPPKVTSEQEGYAEAAKMLLGQFNFRR